MQRSLEMMKQMARTGKGPDRDPVEHHLPLIALVLAGALLVVFVVLRLLS